MKIGQKLKLTYVLMATLVLLLIIGANIVTNSLQREFGAIADQTLQVTRELENLRAAGLRIIASSAEYALIENLHVDGTSVPPEDSRQTREREPNQYERHLLGQGIELYDSAFARYSQIVDQFFPDEIPFRDRIGETGTALVAGGRRLAKLSHEDGAHTELLEAKEELETIENAYLAVITAALLNEGEEFDEREEELRERITNASRLSGVGIIIVAGVIVLLGNYIARSITSPLHTLVEVTNQFGRGDFSARVKIENKDEIGGLASALNQMAGSLESNIKLREHAETDLRVLNEELEQRVNQRTDELRAAQDELLRKERLATLGQLTATVSHELRNPLGTIHTSLFTVSERTRDKGLGVERAIARIERNIKRCDVIIGDLLDFTRVRELELKTTIIDDWLARTLDEYSVPEGIELDRALDAGISLEIDGERLRRTLINVLDNACQAIAEGKDAKGAIAVSSRIGDARLEISVADSGPGIPADVMSKIFTPLFSTKSFGVGLGLPLVQQIMEQHGGGVEIGNQESGGARVLLWLAIDQSEKGLEA